MFGFRRRKKRTSVSIPVEPTGSVVLDGLDTILSVLVILELFDN